MRVPRTKKNEIYPKSTSKVTSRMAVVGLTVGTLTTTALLTVISGIWFFRKDMEQSLEEPIIPKTGKETSLTTQIVMTDVKPVSVQNSENPITAYDIEEETNSYSLSVPNDIGNDRLFSDLKYLYYKHTEDVLSFLENLPSSMLEMDNEKANFKDIRKTLSQYNDYLLNSRNKYRVYQLIEDYNKWLASKKLQKLPKSIPDDRLFSITARGVLVYYTIGDPDINLNHAAISSSGTPVQCRHLALWFLAHPNDYHKPLSALKKGARTKLESLDLNFYDNQHIFSRSDSSAIFTLDKFGNSLYKLCLAMNNGDVKSIMFYSHLHAMAIRVHKKSDADIVIEFYDPTKTVVSLKANLVRLSDLQELELKYFLRPVKISEYFTKFKIGVFHAYDDMQNIPQNHKSNIDIDNMDLSNFEELKLRGGILMALYLGHNEALKIFMNTIFNAKSLSLEQKFTLLRAKRTDGGLGLTLACELGYEKVVAIYVKGVLGDKSLTLQQKFTLLLAYNPQVGPALFMAFQNGHYKTVDIFMQAILEDQTLTPQQKFTIIMARREDDNATGLYMACQKEYEKTVAIYITKILKSKDLTKSQKITLLKGVANERPPLTIAAALGHAKIVKVFINIIFKDQTLTSKEKFLIVEAEYKGYSGLAFALGLNKIEAAEEFIRAILDDTTIPLRLKKGFFIDLNLSSIEKNLQNAVAELLL